MPVKRAVVISVVLVVLLLAGLFIVPSFVDWNKYKGQIIAQIEAATGYDLEIGGDLEMAVLPFPHVSISKLVVTVPSTDGAAVPLVGIDEASVQLALGPLFGGNVEVNKILLLNPDFQLSINQDGVPSWMTAVLKEKTQKKEQGKNGGADIANAITLNAVTVKNGAFHFIDHRSKQAVALKDINLTIQGESLYGPYRLEGGVDYQGYETRVKLNSGRLDKLADSIAAQAEVEFPKIGAAIRYSGVVALKDRLELQGETSVDAQNLAKLMRVAIKDAPDYLQKPFSSKGILTFTDREAAYRNLKIGFAGVDSAGYLVVKNFAKDAKGALNLEAGFETIKPYALETLLPKGEAQAAEQTALRACWPETQTVP